MKTTTEQKISISVPEGSNVRVKINEEEKKVEVLCNRKKIIISEDILDDSEIKGTQEYIEKYFPVVKASELSLEDNFLKYETETPEQTMFKKRLIKVIKLGINDFRAQRMDPTFDKKNGLISYKVGSKPAIGRSAIWWREKAKGFLPEKESREGTTNERVAFLGVLIKYLIDLGGYTPGEAWNAVCNQSKDLGHYWDSEDSGIELEPTGSRGVGDWYDLANTFKITTDDHSGFSLFGGYNKNCSDLYPLADISSYGYCSYEFDYSVGWIVMNL